MHEGHVLYARQDHLHVLRYVGDIRHPLAPSVSTFVDSLIERFAQDDLVVDLSSTDAIDSTNLGEIARIAALLSERGEKRATIVSPHAGISQVLHSMAFDEVFDICTESTSSDPKGEPIPEVQTPRAKAREVILAAHRRLMQMSDANRERFAEVVDLLEQDR